MERKTFLKILVAGAVAGSVLTFIAACKKSDLPEGPLADFNLDLSLSVNSALLNFGGFIISNQVMIINNGGTYIALSDLCTHENCALGFESANGYLVCYCCGSNFDTSGNIINGPATHNLKTYTVTQNGAILHIQG